MGIMNGLKRLFGAFAKNEYDKAPKILKHVKKFDRASAFNKPKHNRKHLRARTIRIQREAAERNES